MQYRKLISMLLILVLVAPWLAPAGKVSAGGSYPEPGNNGLITVKTVDDNSVEIKWKYAFSNTTSSPDLNYRVFKSDNPDLTDATEINNNESDLSYGDWITGADTTSGTFTKLISGLQEGKTYYFNVIVKDRYDLEISYQMQSITFTTPLGEFNKSIGQNYNPSKILELFQNENFISLIPEFTTLPSEEQDAIVAVAGKSYAPGNAYQSNQQVNSLINLIQQGIVVSKTTDLEDMQERLTIYYENALSFAELFGPEYASMIKPNLDNYLTASNVDQQVIAFKLRMARVAGDLSLEQSVMSLSAALSQNIGFNKASTTNDMINSLKAMYNVQLDAKAYEGTDKEASIGTFPLDFGKMKDILSNTTKMEQLADWMLLKKPGNGYSKFSRIQEAFNDFFNNNVDQTPLMQLNEAIANEDKATILTVLKESDLLAQRDDFNELSEQEQNIIAATLGQLIPESKSYNEAQVQFIVNASIQALKAYHSDYRDMATELKDFYELILDKGPTLFSQNDFEHFEAAADFYLGLNEADQRMIAYLAKFTSATLNNESAIGILLMVSDEMPLINKAETASAMWEDLNFYQTLLMQYRLFLNDNPESNLEEFPLVFDNMATLTNQTEQQQLAEWMLSERPLGGYAKLKDIQKAFDLFFAPAAPAVSADDTANVVIGADDTMEYSKDNGITWNKFSGTDQFDGNQKIAVRIRAKGNTPVWKWTILTFTANNSTPNPGNSGGGNTGGNSGGTGGGSSASTPAATPKQEQLVVDVNGVNGTNLTKTPITRTTETNGTIKDFVKMTEAIAKQAVEKAKQLGTDTARIVIPDTKDAVSETRVEVPKTAVKELSNGSLKLEISTQNAVISIPTQSIAGFDQDLYFRIVPLKKESERKEVEDRAKKEQVIQQAAPNANVRVLARPVEIETNMQSREVTLTLPLGNSLPTDAAARQQALNNLAVYIEHSDGTKELVRGKLVKLADSSEGIEFTVTKFSTFTLVSIDGLNAAQPANHPYIQGFGADFRPDAYVTRAQMAAMLARNLSGEAATAPATEASFEDVAATHWAANEIQQAQAAGIMNGLGSSVFAPEGSITRAQMATIAYRWLQKQEVDAALTTGTSTATATSTSTTAKTANAASFTDVPADLWAADAIAYVQSAGLMTGYQDGSFKPDGKLTRAEAVKVLNVLFKRSPLTGAATPSFSDVPATHWAYADIEAAAQK
ncbi:S-layer homology domain-containing protein [Paenibacillus silvae]|uniref:S-layer homology domain-containing protein n=1 Tax=Paenibacillus silvae TaxID=1325358 RepID=UPI0025A25784|nr:S-layer homology domain-containing protein [Paenibacillus silvae]MDM5280857.1 S-layer homology domain-containing protein [Paenibacillus silvae]